MSLETLHQQFLLDWCIKLYANSFIHHFQNTRSLYWLYRCMTHNWCKASSMSKIHLCGDWLSSAQALTSGVVLWSLLTVLYLCKDTHCDVILSPDLGTSLRKDRKHSWYGYQWGVEKENTNTYTCFYAEYIKRMKEHVWMSKDNLYEWDCDTGEMDFYHSQRKMTLFNGQERKLKNWPWVHLFFYLIVVSFAKASIHCDFSLNSVFSSSVSVSAVSHSNSQ